MTARSVAVIGGGSGIGRACAHYFSATGARICIVDMDADGARLVRDECMRDGAGNALGLEADVRDRSAIHTALGAAAEKFGAIDTFIYAAGILRTGPLATISAADFDLVIDVNLKGFFTCVQEVLPHMSATSLRQSIVAVSSISALRPKVGGGVYAASKIGLQYLVRVLAAELGSRGITVNAVAPGTTATPMIENIAASQTGFRLSGVSPMGRISEAADIASAVGFLCSDAAGHISGTVIAVDGATSAAFAPSP